MMNTGLIPERLFAWNLHSAASHCHSWLPLMLLLNFYQKQDVPSIFAASVYLRYLKHSVRVSSNNQFLHLGS